MKKIILISIFAFIGCAKQAQTHPPVGGILDQKDLEVSKNRSKSLNELERSQIQSWINNQNKKFYSMSLNYWVDIENLNKNAKRKEGELISYEYELYDFNNVELYEKPKGKKNVQIDHFEDLRAVQDALYYLKKGQNAILLVPSVLAYGTYGDNNKIPNDMPVIIKLKVL